MTDPADPTAPSVADRLVGELEQGGELVDEGGFDIDAGRALAKLAQFQLVEPRAYVLRLAEVGLLAGAAQLRFDVELNTLRASFDRPGNAVVLPKSVLERLTTVLVSRAPLPAGSPPRALLTQLAVATLAIHRLRPRYFAIESVGADGRGLRRVEVPEPKTEALVGAAPGTRIYVVEGVDVGLVLEAAVDERIEERLLRERCRFARTPIFLDGKRISQQPVLESPLRAERVRDARGIAIGEAGFVAAGGQARVLLLSHGLLIETLVLLDCAPGFVAAIDVPLARDLSQSSIARTPELDAALAPVYAVHARLLR
jgi:hypothetical protein